ncbi:MAG TPA: PKD domain-containing protein, partial [Agriterribacter sp.]|nr:PKD domain-containing protein [Agriterribacter sp.]
MARHITGGEISYINTGASGSDFTYQITLKLYRDCFSTGAQLDQVSPITIYQKNGSGTTFFQNFEVNMARKDILRLGSPGECIDNPPQVCYEVGVYVFVAVLPASPHGYVISYQRCCRIENMSNIAGSGQVGVTYTAEIPGTQVAADAPRNSSATFNTKDTVIVCEDNFFSYDFGANDKDGDSLSYSFSSAYVGGSPGNPQPNPSPPPPFAPVPYAFGFGASSPMGANVTLNTKTGLVSGIAPASGIYVVTVSVNEYRNKVLINSHSKDIQIKVAACSMAAATLDPEYVMCDSFTVNFQNKSTSPLIKTHYWDFGVPGRQDDTSTLARPQYTYADTGTYRVMLVTNRNDNCSDTAFSLVKVYPGFFPGFRFTEGCKDVPIRFIDTTKTRYGNVDSWEWDFGDPLSNDDNSNIQRPQYTFTGTGTYQVALTVSSTKGCRNTVRSELVIRDKPLLSVPHDTLMCSIDTIAVKATGPPGTYTWSPATDISSTAGPVAYLTPPVSATYTVSLTTVPGCTSTDTVRVNVVDFVTLEAGRDTTICLTDAIQFKPSSNGLRYEWTPAETMDDASSKQPSATPDNENTLYSVTAFIGKCSATDNIRVRTVPYPNVRATNDTAICYGDRIQLFAEGGAYYTWSPALSVSNYNVRDPFVSPPSTITYTVSVRDTLGCPKPSLKDVTIAVVPPVPAFAGNDTSVVVGQPLQLFASGAEKYEWFPAAYLNNANIPDPIATFISETNNDIVYTVKVSTPEGCFAYDTVSVKVFTTAPDIFVADAFTPNNDGLNDFFRAIPVGIRQFDYIKIFNRWGQLMFTSNSSEIGWDGT